MRRALAFGLLIMALAAVTGCAQKVSAAKKAVREGIDGVLARAAAAGLPPGIPSVVVLPNSYQVRPNLAYHTVGGSVLALDAYVPYIPRPARTLIYFHGGGWLGDSKERQVLHLLPYLVQGWSVISVEYRRAPEALAPAAVQDCRCAVRWIAAHAAELGVDLRRLVLSGHSAGGHLALMAAFAPANRELDGDCPWPPAPRPRAVVNWFGITDVADVLEGPHSQDFAVQWIGSRPDRLELAHRLSPLSYVTAQAPPVITIHSAADELVPYSQALRLHASLQAQQVPTELVTVRRAGHGNLSPTELFRAYGAVERFLDRYVSDGRH